MSDTMTVESPPEEMAAPAFHRPRPAHQDPMAEGTTVESGQPAAGSDSAGASGSKATASTGSTKAEPKRIKFDTETAAAFAEVIGGVFCAIGGLLNYRLQTEPDSTEWLPEDQDVKMISAPLGRIAARRASLPGGDDVNDITDAIQAAVGGVTYAIKNLQRRMILRRERRRREKGKPVFAHSTDPNPEPDNPESDPESTDDGQTINPTPPNGGNAVMGLLDGAPAV